MQVVHTAYQTKVKPREFVCSRCGFTGLCLVEGRGAGQVTTGQAGKEAASQAATDANASADAFVDLNFRLAPCPRCGGRNEAEVAKIKRNARSVAFVGAGILALGIASIALAMFVDLPLLSFVGGFVALIG